MSSSTCDQNPYWSFAIHVSGRATMSAGSADTACRAVTQRAEQAAAERAEIPARVVYLVGLLVAGGDERLVQPDGALMGSPGNPRCDQFELADEGEGRVFGDIAAGAERFLHRGFDGVAHRTASFVEPLGAERGIVTEVEVDVALERAVGVERGPAAAARVVALVGALPRELDPRLAVAIRVAAVEVPVTTMKPRLPRPSSPNSMNPGWTRSMASWSQLSISVIRHRPVMLALSDMRRD